MKEASFTFTTPLNINIVETKDGERLFVEGDISTTDIDLVNDIMTKECQESMQKQILERNMKLDIEHEAFKGNSDEEIEINKTKIPAGKLIDDTIKELDREGKTVYGTRVKGEINRNRKDYSEIKGNLTEKYLDAFSVAFLPTDIKYEKKGDKNIRYLNDVILLNVALTGNPCNTKAQMVEVIQKSMDALEFYKKEKKQNPEIEKNLIVKSKEKEIRWITVTEDNLEKLSRELSEKLNKGKKLSSKEFRELIEKKLMVKSNSKSHSTDLVGDNQLNQKKESKMTDEHKEESSQEENSEDVSNEAEQKMLKSMSENLKSMDDKLEKVMKENESLKETVTKNSEALEKVTKALEKPIHKSPGVQKEDAENKAKANAQTKSVDPLELL